MYQHWFATLNTRSYSKVNDIYKHIKKYHFIYLQEISKDKAEQIRFKLNFSDKKEYYSILYKDGSCILTSFLILEHEINYLNVGHGTEEDIYFFLKIDLCGYNTNDVKNHVNILCCHLDKHSEKTRKEQLVSIDEKVEDCHVLMGCLNSLYSPDYTPKQLLKINKQREMMDQEMIVYEVTEYLEKDKRFTFNKFEKPTCSDGSRLDYILIKEKKNMVCMMNDITKINNMNNRTTNHIVESLLHKTGRSLFM